MNKRDLLMVLFLLLLIVGAAHTECFGALRVDLSAPKELDENVVAKSQASVSHSMQQDTVQRPQIMYKGQGSRDPFEPLVREEQKEVKVVSGVEVKPMPALTVQGMIWGSALPQAIINNKVVRVGDTINDVIIKAIDKKGVTVIFANKEHLLTTFVATENKGANKE